MKKLILLLGSLLVVISASAKETVPAPTTVEEAPIQVVEKEVIVYRDKEEGFRPNGVLNLETRFYGKAEELNYRNNEVKNNYTEINLSGDIQMTENQSFTFEVKSFSNWNHSSDDPKQKGEDGNEIKLDYFYNHGTIGDSKIEFISRIEYENVSADEAQRIEYWAGFNLAQYMFNNDYIKTTDFTIGPKYEYEWADSNDDDYINKLGINLESMTELPLNFAFELNIFAQQNFLGKKYGFDSGRKEKDKDFTIDVEVYLYNVTNLYTSSNEKFMLDFVFEGGYDQYNWSQYKLYGHENENSQKASYSLYAYPGIQGTYQVTPAFSVYAVAGAEYRNWEIESEKSASHWRWQPTVTVGMTTVF